MSHLIRRLRSIVLGGGLVALVGVLTPIWFVHDRFHRLASLRRGGGVSPIPRVAASNTSIDELLSTGTPVIVEGLAEHLGIATAATSASLRDRVGAATLDVAFHDAASPYFLYSGGYGATVDHRRTMTIDGFLDMMFGTGPDHGSVVYQLLGVRACGGRIAEELDEFDQAISSATDHRTEARFSGIWIGSAGVVTPLHHDAWPGLLFQTEGRKRVAMYHPGDRPNLSFRTPLKGAGRWSNLPARSSEADPGDFPGLSRTRRLEAELGPGDTLYIPPFWPHEMEGLEPNISVPFRLAQFRRSYLDPGFLRPASELVRARLSA
ncbi:MAG: cupin-like domain-containing protein [Ilumatobacteraceae bacterium]